MKEAGIPVTRENYIATNLGEPLPEWTAELEAELPEELQDWSLFEVEGQGLKRSRSKGGRATATKHPGRGCAVLLRISQPAFSDAACRYRER